MLHDDQEHADVEVRRGVAHDPERVPRFRHPTALSLAGRTMVRPLAVTHTLITPKTVPGPARSRAFIFRRRSRGGGLPVKLQIQGSAYQWRGHEYVVVMNRPSR